LNSKDGPKRAVPTLAVPVPNAISPASTAVFTEQHSGGSRLARIYNFFTASGSSNNIDMYNSEKYNKNIIAHENDKNDACPRLEHLYLQVSK